MSILLDALRRSEEQRRLGEVPDIHSPLASGQADSPGWRRWAVWGAAGAIALAVVWAGWQRFGTGDAAPAAAVESAEVITGGAETARRAPAEKPSGDGTNEPAAAPAGAAKPRRARVNQSFTEFEASQQPLAGQAPVAPPQAAQSAPPAAEAPAVAPPDQPAATPAPRPEPRAAEPRATQPISFWELPQGVRDSLPDLRITVLVYAERPEDRFVLLAGTRMVEKDTLQDGVVLVEIRRDGAVFTYRNYRFLVKG